MSKKNSKRVPENIHVVGLPDSYAALADAKLVEMVCGGDKHAFEHLMRRYTPIVTAFLWGRMWERDEIADLAQDIFLRAYLKIGQLREGARFSQWLLRIARHTWVEYCRSPDTQRRKLHISLEVAKMGAGHDAVDSGTDPARSAADRELEELVRGAIGGLREHYRQIMYLRLIEEKSYKEIADLTGLQENAVRTRFSRGVSVLRKSLVRNGLEPF